MAQGSAPGTTVGIYWPKHFYPRDNPHNAGNHPRQLSRWRVMANYYLPELGYRTCVVRGDLSLDPENDYPSARSHN
jgi:hypothetical protein